MKHKTSKILKKYLEPTLNIEIIHTECSISAGSANVVPFDNTSQVKSEWETSGNVPLDQAW